MANTYINISFIGDGVITYAGAYVSSSTIQTGSLLVSASDSFGSGIYEFGYDYKFLTNKNLLQIIAAGNGGLQSNNIVSSSIDNSFTIRSGSYTASINVMFKPKIQSTGILVKDPTAPVDNPMDVFTVTYSPITNQETLLSGVTLPTDNDYANGYMYRYFYKKFNNSRVKELTKVQYNGVPKSGSSKKLEIKWKITGEEADVKQINDDILDIADRTLPGIKLLLKRNLLQFWNKTKDYVNVQFDVTDIIKSQNMRLQ